MSALSSKINEVKGSVMDQEYLSQILKSEVVHRKILKAYAGAYSIGITINPQNAKQLAIKLDVEGDDLEQFPTSLSVGKEEIPVIVTGHFALLFAVTT